MKEEQMIAKITRDSFKKRELRFTRIETLGKSKEDLTKTLESRQHFIEPYIQFCNKCHLIPIKDLYLHDIVVMMLRTGSLKIFQLSHNGIKWESWKFIEEEYNDKLERRELFFYEPVKTQVSLFIDSYNKNIMKPIMKKMYSIDKRIERSKREISAIQITETQKIYIEEAFLHKKYIPIFKEMNMLIYSVTQSIEYAVKQKMYISSQHLNTCIHMMRYFSQERMVNCISKGMGESFDKSITLSNTYKILPRVFSLLMKLEKQVKTRIRRNTLYIRPILISSFVKEINLFKKKYNRIWISFYTSNIPYILAKMNFSDILIQHIYEYVYGLDKPIEYFYKKPSRLPQSRSLTA
jgi:hypothetical protein